MFPLQLYVVSLLRIVASGGISPVLIRHVDCLSGRPADALATAP